MSLKIRNKRNFRQQQESIEFYWVSGKDCMTELFLTITEAKALMAELQTRIMFAEANELIASLLRTHNMDESQIETAIKQLNKMREKL
jgi:hypothetical protein